MQESADYRLDFLPLFYDELNEAAMYITEELQNPDAADRLVDAVMAAIYQRLPFAEAFEPVPSREHRDLPYYRIYVNNFVIYYVVVDSAASKTMEIRRFVFKRKDMRDI